MSTEFTEKELLTLDFTKPALFRAITEEKWMNALSGLLKKNVSTLHFYEHNVFPTNLSMFDNSNNYISCQQLTINNIMEYNPIYQYRYHVVKEEEKYYKLTQYFDLSNNTLIREQKKPFDDDIYEEAIKRISHLQSSNMDIKEDITNETLFKGESSVSSDCLR